MQKDLRKKKKSRKKWNKDFGVVIAGFPDEKSDPDHLSAAKPR